MTITETTFGPRKYLALKKSISTSQISDKGMYDEAGKKLGEYMERNGIVPTGPWSVMYFTWDEAAKTTDMAIAFPVGEVSEVYDPEFSLIEILESKAALLVLEGSYEGLSDAHQKLVGYTEEKGYSDQGLTAIAVEEYVVGPMNDPAPANWKTNIYYIHN